MNKRLIVMVGALAGLLITTAGCNPEFGKPTEGKQHQSGGEQAPPKNLNTADPNIRNLNPTGQKLKIHYRIQTLCLAKNTKTGQEIEVPYSFSFHIQMTAMDIRDEHRIILVDGKPYHSDTRLSTSPSTGYLEYTLTYDEVLAHMFVNATADTGHVVVGPCSATLEISTTRGRHVTSVGHEFIDIKRGKVGSFTFNNTFVLPDHTETDFA